MFLRQQYTPCKHSTVQYVSHILQVIPAHLSIHTHVLHTYQKNIKTKFNARKYTATIRSNATHTYYALLG